MQYDYIDALIRYDMGEDLEEVEFLRLFQQLIDTGLAWRLQGRIGRTAADLIEAGYCHPAQEDEGRSSQA